MVARQSNRLALGVASNNAAAARLANAAAISAQQQRTYAEVLPHFNPATAPGASSSSDLAEKYRAKLEQKAAQEGLSSVSELKEKYKEKIDTQTTKFNEADPYAKINQATGATNTGLNETGQAASEAIKNAPKVPSSDIKELDTFVDVEKFKLHDRKEIEMLWKLRFSSNPLAICGIIEDQVFATIYKNARQNPMFVLPLPREAPEQEGATEQDNSGVEMHLVQWSFVGPYTIHCLFTTLAEYKLHQEYAKPHTTLVLHSDLLTDKGIALMNGSVEKNVPIKLEDAHLLTLFLQKFYGANSATASGKRKIALLEGFTKGDVNFSVDALCSEIESLD